MGNFAVKDVVRTVLHVPFHERCADAMEVYGPGWSIVELIEVETEGGVVGVGETIQGYTWGRSLEAQFARVRGRNIFELLWDDALGAGLQMALFDAAGKHLEVPCHQLLGPQHRDACPVSWWAQSMAPEAWMAEARAAEAHGFNTMKVKARPWYDIAAQLQAVDRATSQHFKLDTDFNTMLLGIDLAAPLIAKLERDNDCLAIVESPIPQDDVEGNKLLRRKIRSPIAMHLGQPPVMTAIREGVCDGFVIGGGVRQVLSDGNLAARAQMPFWLQMVGTGLTTTFAAHLGSVLKEARWPAIPCVNIYSHTLLREFEVVGGHLRVPEGPGLGVELDREAVERLRVEADFAKEAVRQIHVVRWPDGRELWAVDGGYRSDFVAGKITGFLPGMGLEVRLDDGSEEFGREYRERFGG
ncbi:MAG: mandelate racemase/muconate lactonizing enzyme family protein [Candidatus Latescibacterota bacterium]|nr:mandelate racemase/muconate lactonizing enzyme family protein [Candidatus Latescibacterota bacterium]